MNLSTFATRLRKKLDDTKATIAGSYGWDNDELTDDLNETVNEICTLIPLIVDATTASICTHALLAGGYSLAISERVTGIQRVELASTGAILGIVTDVHEMDALYPSWKSTTASVPQKFIKDGLGENVARVWPATLLADTIYLTVSRMPLADLVWATDQANVIGIPEMYHDKLFDGVLARAYRKHDVDTENKRLAEAFEKKWGDRVEEIRRAHLYKGSVPHIAAPSGGWM